MFLTASTCWSVLGSCKTNLLAKQFSGHLQDPWITTASPLPRYSSSSLWKHRSKPVSEMSINIKDNKMLMKYFHYCQRRWGKSKGKRWTKSLEKLYSAGENQFCSRGKRPRKSTWRKRSVEKPVFIKWKRVKAGSEYLAELIPILPSAHVEASKYFKIVFFVLLRFCLVDCSITTNIMLFWREVSHLSHLYSRVHCCSLQNIKHWGTSSLLPKPCMFLMWQRNRFSNLLLASACTTNACWSNVCSVRSYGWMI